MWFWIVLVAIIVVLTAGYFWLRSREDPRVAEAHARRRAEIEQEFGGSSGVGPGAGGSPF